MRGRDLYLRLLKHVVPYWRAFAVSIAAMVLFALTEPAMPALLQPIIDGSFINKDRTYIVMMPLILIGLFIVRGLASYVSSVATAWVSGKLILDLRQAMFDKLLTLPSTVYDDASSGKLLTKLTFVVSQVTAAATHVLRVVVTDTLAVLGLLGLMLYLNWQLTLFVLLVAPVIALIVKLVSRRLRTLSRSLQQNMGQLTHRLEETIEGIKIVKLFNGEAYERKRFADTANWVRRLEVKLIQTSAAYVPVVQLIIVLALAAILYIASLQSAQDAFTTGQFMSFFAAMAMLFSPIKRLTSVNEQLQRGLAAAEEIFSLIDQESEPDRGTHRLGRATGKIQFDHVWFRYGDTSQAPALSDIDVTVAAGETIALVGASGSGKTTFVNLIPRFYVPTRGCLRIDDIDIQDIRLADLRRNISLVSQDVVLFNDTIAANIAYGKMDEVSEEQIIAAAEAAHAMEFIAQMPEGLQAQIGENGVKLSGGQRQRIAIARALLKDAPILILDEATSALDTESERHVQAALETLMNRRTTLVIAHRLSTIENADRILVLERGRIIEQGTHTQLLAAQGRYATLYEMQFSQQASADPVVRYPL